MSKTCTDVDIIVEVGVIHLTMQDEEVVLVDYVVDALELDIACNAVR